jgi:hypothetical protein
LQEQTAALGFGGYLGTPPGETGATEEYNGSTWTASPPGLNTVRRLLGGCGTQTAALAFGGMFHLKQELLKNMMDQLGHLILRIKHNKISISRLWYTNCSFSFWW